MRTNLALVEQVYRYTFRYWELDEVLCKLSFYSFYSFFMASAFTLVAMSLERSVILRLDLAGVIHTTIYFMK